MNGAQVLSPSRHLPHFYSQRVRNASVELQQEGFLSSETLDDLTPNEVLHAQQLASES